MPGSSEISGEFPFVGQTDVLRMQEVARVLYLKPLDQWIAYWPTSGSTRGCSTEDGHRRLVTETPGSPAENGSALTTEQRLTTTMLDKPNFADQ